VRLRELLDDADSEVQFEAVSGVLELRDDGSLEKLAELAERAERSRVRAQAVAALARIEMSKRARGLLWRVLDATEDENVAAQALDSLRYYKLDGAELLKVVEHLNDVREVTIHPASDVMNAMLMARLRGGNVLPPELLAPATSQPETQPEVMTVADYAIRLLRRQTGQYFGFDARAAESKRRAAILHWRDFLEHRGA
jgi:HEAT repeat protein